MSRVGCDLFLVALGFEIDAVYALEERKKCGRTM